MKQNLVLYYRYFLNFFLIILLSYPSFYQQLCYSLDYLFIILIQSLFYFYYDSTNNIIYYLYLDVVYVVILYKVFVISLLYPLHQKNHIMFYKKNIQLLIHMKILLIYQLQMFLMLKCASLLLLFTNIQIIITQIRIIYYFEG